MRTYCAHPITPIVQNLYYGPNVHIVRVVQIYCALHKTTVPQNVRVLGVLLLPFVTSEVLPIVSFVTDCYYPKV
jgi:hypothetical protein